MGNKHGKNVATNIACKRASVLLHFFFSINVTWEEEKTLTNGTFPANVPKKKQAYSNLNASD